MRTQLIKHGNSLALVINQPVLDQLKVDAKTSFEISTDGEVLILAPVKNANRREAFETALKETNKKYGRALKRLAQ